MKIKRGNRISAGSKQEERTLREPIQVLIQRAEAGVHKLLESLQSIEKGDLKGLEQ